MIFQRSFAQSTLRIWKHRTTLNIPDARTKLWIAIDQPLSVNRKDVLIRIFTIVKFASGSSRWSGYVVFAVMQGIKTFFASTLVQYRRLALGTWRWHQFYLTRLGYCHARSCRKHRVYATGSANSMTYWIASEITSSSPLHAQLSYQSIGLQSTVAKQTPELGCGRFKWWL